MDMFGIYGVFTLVSWGIISFLLGFVVQSKFWKKHLKPRKKILFFLALFSLALFWISLEGAADPSTLEIFWSIHAVLFLLYVLWSSKKIYDDYIRIKRIEERRK